MKLWSGRFWAAALAAVCLCAAGCSGGAGESSSAGENGESAPPAAPVGEAFVLSQEEGADIAMLAFFHWEDGRAVSEGSVCVSQGEAGGVYPLDSGGALYLSGLTAGEAAQLMVMDGASRELGRTAVHFARGAVIDASTDENGDGCVTLKEDASYVALIFTLDGSGGLQCALRLET